MKRAIFGPVLSALVVAFCVPAVAQQDANSGFVYNMKMSQGPGSSTTFALAVTVKSTARDGSRSASVLVKWPQMMMLNGKRIDATITPAGAIQLASTGDLKASYSPAQAAAMSAAATGPMVQMFLNPINMFAAACAAAPSQKAGALWHALSPEQMDVLYTVTGHEQQAGHDTLVVKMTNPSPGSAGYTGQGNYDLVTHMVVNLHSEMRQAPQGPAEILDATLSP